MARKEVFMMNKEEIIEELSGIHKEGTTNPDRLFHDPYANFNLKEGDMFLRFWRLQNRLGRFLAGQIK